MQTLSRDEAAILTGQEDKARGDFTGLTWSAHGYTVELVLGFLVHGGHDKGGPYCLLMEGSV